MAIWAIIATIGSPMLGSTPTTGVDYYNSSSTCNLNNLVPFELFPYYQFCPALNISITPDRHVIQYLIMNNSFNFLLIIGCILTMIVLLFFIVVILFTLEEENKNYEKLRKFMGINEQTNNSYIKEDLEGLFNNLKLHEQRLQIVFYILILLIFPLTSGIMKIIPDKSPGYIFLPAWIPFYLTWITGADIISFIIFFSFFLMFLVCILTLGTCILKYKKFTFLPQTRGIIPILIFIGSFEVYIGRTYYIIYETSQFKIIQFSNSELMFFGAIAILLGLSISLIKNFFIDIDVSINNGDWLSLILASIKKFNANVKLSINIKILIGAALILLALFLQVFVLTSGIQLYLFMLFLYGLGIFFISTQKAETSSGAVSSDATNSR